MYNLEEFKRWLEEEPSRKAGLEWNRFFSASSSFAAIIGWAESNRDNTLNTYRQQYQILWGWKALVDERERERESKYANLS